MHSFNLVTDPWIPVVWNDGKNGLASLHEAFTDDAITDLNADPCERIALTRLLMLVSHRVADLSIPVLEYLESWKNAFDLGDEKGGFLRLPNVTAAESLITSSTEYLQFQRGSKASRLTLEQVALGILTFQCCYPGGLCARNLSVEGTPIAKVSAECSPSMEGGPIYSFIIGETLLDTISRNLLPKNAINGELGVPVWEAFSTDTFLGRLLPLSYSIAFSPGFECMSYGPAPHSYQNQTQDPWLAYRATPKGSAVVRINSEKSLWRELPAIAAVPEPGKRGGSLLLQQSRNLVGSQVWVGGMAKFQANIKTLVESRFDLSGDTLENLRTEGYLKAFTGSEDTARRLAKAVKEHIPWANPGEAQMRYWNRLDSSKQLLFDLMSSGEDATPWSTHYLQTARTVLAEVCDATTAREYRALTIAKSKL